MSQKALKKRELLNLYKQEKETPHQIYRKQPIAQKQSTKYVQRPAPVSTTNFSKDAKYFSQPHDNGVNKRKSISTPNLSDEHCNRISTNQTNDTNSSPPKSPARAHSESDLATIPENRILVNAKSEFHLKSIASTQVTRPQHSIVNNNKCDLAKKPLPHPSAMQPKRMSMQSDTTSRMACSITSSASDSTQTQSPTTGFADVDNIRVPIIGYEVMEERARFTVNITIKFPK